MFSPMTLDLSDLDCKKHDDDRNSFTSSTPKRAVSRSHSEERHVVHAEIHPRPRSASQNPADISRTSQDSNSSKNSKRPLPPTPSPHNSRPTTPESPALSVSSNKSKKDKKKKKKDVDTLSNNASDNSLDENFLLSSKGSNDLSKHAQQQHQQQRLYRPRVVVPGRQTSGSYSPSIQQKQQNFNTTSSKPNLGRYISHSSNHNIHHHHHHHHNQYYNHQALPSRMTMVLTTKPGGSNSKQYNILQYQQAHQQYDRSRPRKRVMSPSPSGKMKEIRNRSQHSPHHQNHHHHHQQSATNSSNHPSRSNKRPTSLPPQRDREFLKVIQSSVERRQRAHRLSLYQLPDQDDETWRID